MKMRTLILVMAISGFLGVGCRIVTDAVTGQQTRVLDPNSSLVIGGEAAAQMVAGYLPFLGPLGAAAGGIILGILGAWRKVKPSLTTARTEAEHYHAVAAATVAGVEEFKTTNPEQWESLGALLSAKAKEQGIDPRVLENVIRALRGLPAKA
jgi:hypothetical protein